jgi:hypothetical protein
MCNGVTQTGRPALVEASASDIPFRCVGSSSLRGRRPILLTCLLLPALAAALGAAAPVQAAASKATLVIVTQKSSALVDLSLRELKRMYASEPVTSPDGTRLIPINHPGGVPVRVGFDERVLDMDPDYIGRFWIDRKIRGQTGAPKAVSSVEMLRRAVATVPGTVTYLAASDVTADLKVVTVDGKRPTDADYPLLF